MKKTIPGGLFVSFEGPECSGKSTQGALLAKCLRSDGYSVLETREPGGTVIGEQVRQIVKHVCGEDAVCDEAELFLFAASRAQLMHKIVRPFLATGGVVICDRFADSTVAYQGYGRGFDLALIHQLNCVATADRFPDLTILIDLAVESVLRRGQMRLETLLVQDRIEEESRRFHEVVRQGYLTIAREQPDRIRVIDGEGSVEQIHEQITRLVRDAITDLL